MARVPRVWVAATTISIALVGCSRGAGHASVATVRDSAGVRIVENTGPGWAAGKGWTVSPEPLLDIGVQNGDPRYQLHTVVGALRLSDGRIVVANGGSRELRVYDASGAHLASIGRKGEGPGEFQTLNWLGLIPGDSLLTLDRAGRRISVFDPSGAFVRTAVLQQSDGGPLQQLVGRLADGSLAVSVGRTVVPGGADGLVRPPAVYLRYRPDGTLLDTIRTLPGAESIVKTEGEGRSYSFTIMTTPLSRRPVAAVAGDELYYGASDSYQIDIYTADGTHRRSVRRLDAERPVTSEDIARMKRSSVEAEAQRTGTLTVEARRAIEKRYDQMPVPRTMPAYDRIRVDAARNLWVAEFVPPGVTQPPRWTVFDENGQLLGTVVMPERFTLLEIGPDYVLGRWQDDLDVEHVRLHRLVR